MSFGFEIRKKSHVKLRFQ